MFKSAVYYGDSLLGEVEVYPQNSNTGTWIREIRISQFSSKSDRCPALAILHTIASAGICFKMESKPPQSDESLLFSLHADCLRENKTAIVSLGDEELHLVAMSSRKSLIQYSCFWGFCVEPGLYNSCLNMLNLRCLGIVFDLDETLIVANTMRSFEDKIDALQRKINCELDPQRASDMLAEVKRYQDDKSILKQYAETDQVIENGMVLKVQSEMVPPLSDNHQLITRPIIRLQEKNIILTRINPAIRDTSVLVRLRPAWEDLRSYLTARGRKRFEVYVCTMAERDYALEMWRLLDPESSLINSKELLGRVVCVKSGLKKSLVSVFQGGICHPKMALVIDDRLKVWNENDQHRVHVVPAFAPYYSPQAEGNNAVPVLCVARNVACNVRGGFFKEFDEGLLPRSSDVFYEDEMGGFPSAPDVGKYLIPEEDNSASNGNKDPLCFEGMTDIEVDRRLKDANCNIQAVPPMINNLDPRQMSSLHHVMVSSSSAVSVAASQLMMHLPHKQCSQSIASVKPLGQTGPSDSSSQGSPAREEGEVPESELDPDTRRRLLILQHGQDTREPPPPTRPPPLHVSATPVQSAGSLFTLEEEMEPRQINRKRKEFPLGSEAVHFDKNRSHRPSFFPGGENSIPSDRVLRGNQRFPIKVHHGDDQLRLNHELPDYTPMPGEMHMGQMFSNNRDVHLESGRVTAQYSETVAGVLQEIATKCGTKMEFLAALSDTKELQFSIEVWFIGEKIGEGIGRTRKEAQHQAAENSLRNLANKYVLNVLPKPTALSGDLNKLSHDKEISFISDSNSSKYPAFPKDNPLPIAILKESRSVDKRLEGSNTLSTSVAALKELCTVEGLSLVFQAPPSLSAGSIYKGEVHAQAAEEAIETLKPMLGQSIQKLSGSQRSLETTPSTLLKPEFSQLLH